MEKEKIQMGENITNEKFTEDFEFNKLENRDNDLKEIANEIESLSENIILIYAFNGTGKTQLSVKYKDYTKELSENNTHKGIYYNAYSEDLFVWNNDTENNGEDIKLKVTYSSLNDFHSYLDEDIVREKLKPFNLKFNFEFETHDNIEKGIESIIFFIESDKENLIKISRGEERIFVWCFFLALFEVEALSVEQDAHFFIDDPVSSLDDHNIYITALTIFDLILEHFKNRKIIITSHHFGLLSILSDWLSKGEYVNKFIDKKKNKKYKQFFLEIKDEKLLLVKPKDGVCLYHLRLLQLLNEAIPNRIYTYHFALLRQVLENIASFLGVGKFNYVLEQIGIKNKSEIANIINALNHQKIYYQQSKLESESNKQIFINVVRKLMDKYKFQI